MNLRVAGMAFLGVGVMFTGSIQAATRAGVPPSWEVLPIPRYVDYDFPKSFVTAKNVAIVRSEGGLYKTVRDENAELVGQSTITEEELTSILKDAGVSVKSVSDDQASYDDFDTLILLGNPQHNKLTEKYFKEMKLSFAKWDDPNTPEHDFNDWKDFGREGYILKVAKSDGKNIIILAGYDKDDANPGFFPGAGTFYALQSFRQLLVKAGDTVKVKTAEIADKPLLAIRSCMTGSPPDEKQNWRDVTIIPQIKANQNNYWYGHAVAEYCTEASVKFRYPWRPMQLKFFGEIGKFCREHFVTMVFSLNPDHYGVDWAAPKTFDGKKKDPLHYDLNQPVEPQFKEMWAKVGYAVQNDIDVVAAKFAQINRACGGSAMLTMMNEDDGFGLFNEADKKLFNTETGDPKQNAINYGKARAQFLVALYRRVRELAPDSKDMIPLCPPGSLVYQAVLERNEAHSREFLGSLSATLKELGLQEKMPLMTTGGGTAAEAVTTKQIDDFKSWCLGGPVLIHDNNFPFGFHVGAYETDPNGPRWPNQVNKNYPAGYRDKELYKRLAGIIWNGLTDQHAMAWCQSQFMWNMLALDREKVNALATRKVSTEKSYLLVKSFYDEFNQPACYLPDNPPPFRLKVINKRIVFGPKEPMGWAYDMSRSDALRLECQRLRDKLSELMPLLATKWENEYERDQSLKTFGANSLSFCDVFLAYGYIKGWPSPTSLNVLTGPRLRDLYLEADDIQERFFAGPDAVPGKIDLVRNGYYGSLQFIYTDGASKAAPKTPEDASVDIWREGLLNNFFRPLSSMTLADVPDGDARLAGGWGKVEEAETNKFRTMAGQGSIRLEVPARGRVLVRMRMGTGTASLTDSTKVTLSAGKVSHEDAVCKPRWITWFLPANESFSGLTLKTDKPVRVYAVELYQEKKR